MCNTDNNMSTRCLIQVWQHGKAYTLYRHTDGYPAGVLADIKRMWDNGIKPGDAEYFLANFVFLAKYNMLKQGLSWSLHYGICGNDMGEEHGDIQYKYRLWYNKSNIKEHEGWYIEIWERQSDIIDRETWTVIFYGKLEDAFKKYIIPDFENGCHITEIPPLP